MKFKAEYADLLSGRKKPYRWRGYGNELQLLKNLVANNNYFTYETTFFYVPGSDDKPNFQL